MNDISKECEKILADIRENLKGDKQKDIRYLMAMFKKYEKHPQAKVIQGECIRKMFELMTEEERAELLKKLTPDYSWVDKSLNEAVESINAGDIDKAVEIMEELVRRVEELDVYKDDDENEYHSFDEPFEEVLYRNVIKPKKNIRQAEIPYGQIYRLYGSLMIEKKKLTEARKIFLKGMKWNPVSFAIMSEYIETYKMAGDMEQFFLLSKTAFGMVFRAKDVARCYRNLGYYFIEKQLYSEAVGCYHVSREYEPDAATLHQELDYIKYVAGNVEIPTQEQFREYSEKYGFPPHGNPIITKLALIAAQHCSQNNQKQIAEYFFAIANELSEKKGNE